MAASAPPTAAQLRAAFDAPAPLTIGLEEEVMVLDPSTLDLLPRALEVLAPLAGDDRFKPELPAAQLEIVTAPQARVGDAIAALATARRDLAAAASGLARFAAAGVHPFAAGEGVLNDGERYRLTAREYGRIARRQLVCAFQVHVAVGGADRSLAVYNALRSYLPELAALAANAPYHEGADTGLASVRPKISEQLPRQGMPPSLESWDAFAAELAWGAAAGAVPAGGGRWWWELRPHPAYGTLEVRVPDSQASIADAAAVAAVVHALVGRLSERYDEGSLDATRVPTWRLEENRWSACRDGVAGTLADLATGERRPTRQRLLELLEEIDGAAARLGCAAELASARALVERNGAIRQRETGDPHAAAAWLADAFARADGRVTVRAAG
ncbi:MAG: glutamate---cysteine ligase / carboxylate-amine ligase [Solirubrobacteraceae bacterium]|nr:glutamate---cysteine ligase / carboxylate-amine ligase [Solirubrobacteraceae bacterium]